METILLAFYLVLVGAVSVHGAHRLWMVWAYLRHRGVDPTPPLPTDLPVVTVQLPVYNERDVIGRLVDAVAELDWPADKLQIQLLDDSTDDTGERAAPAIVRARARGIDVSVLRRTDRAGFKAGALAAGLASARGELIAIFDADFVPAPDFLRRLVPHFGDPGVGMVQARWGHLNASASRLTAAESVLLDGHFVIEHTARARTGRWFNFNGTAGMWRRAAIEGAGGWQHDTLTEDLDLSYRAQLAGWRFVYLFDTVVPAEVPDGISAFRAQQRRWAKGSTETALKLGKRILASPWPLRVRAEALFHLGANFAWPFALLLALILPAVIAARGDDPGFANLVLDLPFFVLSTGANVLFYALARREARHRGRPSAPLLAVLALGTGLALNQTLAVLEALTGRRTPFVRTPKSGGGPGSYAAAISGLVPFELAISTLHVGAAAWAARAHLWGSIPFLLLFGAGFAWIGLAGVHERIVLATRAGSDLSPSDPLPDL